ncbi:MAG TPA: ATP-dependent zinc metalloprotease FtsH [Candidatus Dormibacteraeota bacterium]|nr:ATP-dependent zinc metalloprotease FtsH [Candidatus Dormibacteraeota bacterium]
MLVLAALLEVAGFLFAINYVYLSAPSNGQALVLSDLISLGNNQQIHDATFRTEDARITGDYCSVPLKNSFCIGDSKPFFTDNLPSDLETPTLIGVLQQNGATVQVDPQPAKSVLRFVTQFVLPLVFLATLFGIIFLAKSGQGSISDIVGFGQIGRRKKKRLSLSTEVNFSNVAGADEAVTELREVRDYLLDPKRYQAFGAQPPKGVLLFGPPGCGKTLLARAVAGESGVPFFSVSGAEFVESLVGVGAARVRDLFRQARMVAPAIIFIDEIDAVGRRRGGGTGGSDEREQTLNQMLVAMDGFEVTSGIVVMGATNRPDILDPALLRPGRFDRHVTLEEPDRNGREAILELHARDKPLAADVDLEYVARRTPGFTGADLANVINEAALLALREEHAEIRMPQLTEAIQRVLHGPRRRGRLMTTEERKRLAYHESGHALVAAALGRLSEVQRVSVIARGRGMGQTIVSTEADRVLLTRGELEDQITVALGGTAAEEIRFGEPSTSAEDDIEKVSEIARQMVGRYGMSANMGALRFIGRDSDVFLGGEATGMVPISAETMQSFDTEVKRLVDAAKQRALDVLVYHQEHLERIAERLEELETLEGTELEMMLAPVRPEMNFVSAGVPIKPGGNGTGDVFSTTPAD